MRPTSANSTVLASRDTAACAFDRDIRIPGSSEAVVSLQCPASPEKRIAKLKGKPRSAETTWERYFEDGPVAHVGMRLGDDMRPTTKMLIAIALAVLTLFGFGAQADGGVARTARAQQFLWGAWIGPQFTGAEPPWSWKAVTDFEARNAGGRHVSLVHWGVGTAWGHNLNYWLSPLDRVRRAGATSLVDMGTGSASLRAVADGAFDGALRTWAIQARIWGHPFLLRFDFEMNGSWYPWGTRPTNRNTPADYVAAWRHVHDIFTAAGATNVSWVWCPNSIPPHHRMTSFASLYPGAAYVDWTCLDGYNFGTPWTSFARLFASSYHQVMRLAPTKPMLVGEVASTGQGANKARWIRGMFHALATRFRNIRGLAWFDKRALVNNRPYDWPIETSTAASGAFSRGISKMAAK